MKSWPDVDIPLIPVEIDSLFLADAMTGVKKEIRPPDSPSYIYVCGITPYDSTHIGHATTYVFFDVLHRVLKASKKPIVMIENVTDIDDPLFKKAQEMNCDWQELAQEQVSRFTKDMTNLRVLPPRYFVSVSETFDTLLGDIQRLLDSGSAYTLDGDIYFKYAGDTATPEELRIFKERGGDPDREGKQHPLDAILWKSTSDTPNFASPWGSGRPGWHIECVSIIEKYAQQPLLIQAGGSDLLFPHHQLSSQQFCALTGQTQLAEVYFHVAMVNYKGEKMSKSLGNLVFVDELLSEGYSAMEIRYALLMQDYGKTWEWTPDILKEAQIRYQHLLEALSCEMTADAGPTIDSIVKHLGDDLNTRGALDALDKWATLTRNGSGEHIHAGLVSRSIDALLGIGV